MKDLNYFDEQLNNAQQHKVSDLPDEIFWIDSIPKKKKTTLLMPVLIIFLASALVLLFFAMTRIVFGKGFFQILRIFSHIWRFVHTATCFFVDFHTKESLTSLRNKKITVFLRHRLANSSTSCYTERKERETEVSPCSIP